MLVCINCGRSFENAKYCMFCGTLLRQKIVNYETSGTLLRSNLDPESVSPIVSPTVNMGEQEDQKKTAVCVLAAVSGGSVGGTAPDLSIEPVSVKTEKTDDKPIEEDISFDDFMTRMDESAVSDETESSDPQTLDSSAEHDEIEEPQEIEVSEVEVETTEPVSEQTEEFDDKPIEEDISFDDFMTGMDESAVSDETESSDPQTLDSSAEHDEVEEPQEIEVSEVEVETAEPVSVQTEKADDKPIEEDISFDD
ncbi:MAG: hypothetical protein IJ861_10305, partial [Clostridia bacterium]|nr:hypothetical protein [Clostridia bacterium]